MSNVSLALNPTTQPRFEPTVLQSQHEQWEQLNIDEGCRITIKLCLKYFTTKYKVTIEKTLYAHKKVVRTRGVCDRCEPCHCSMISVQQQCFPCTGAPDHPARIRTEGEALLAFIAGSELPKLLIILTLYCMLKKLVYSNFRME